MLDFLKLAGMRTCPRICGYPWIAGTGIVSYPLRVAGAGAGADFSMRVRVYEVDIRVDFTPLLENGPWAPAEKGLRHRFPNRCPATATNGLALRHRVFQPVP